MATQESTVRSGGSVGMTVMVACIVMGAIFLAWVYGGGWPATLTVGETQKEARPTQIPYIDRGADTVREDAAPLLLATPAQPKGGAIDRTVSPPTWADELPDCATGQTPCAFKYGEGVPAPVAEPNLATGGTNTGTDGHPQKDIDLLPAWGGDKP